MSLRRFSRGLRRGIALVGGNVSATSAVRFGVVGLLGLGVDMGVFGSLRSTGTSLAAAHIASFWVATVVNYVLNQRWAFRSLRDEPSTRVSLATYARFLTVCLMALFLRGGVLALLVERARWSAPAALAGAVGAAAIVNYLGCAFFVFPRPGTEPAVRTRVATLGLLGYLMLLRLVYLGVVDLVPEEAYYWNYAQHPALSYLDHPPVVAWIIRLGTSVFGNTEFGVRIGTFFLWLVTAGFSWAFARDLYDRTTALRAVLLVATLPFFAAVGFFTTPDTPLCACWAGALFFLQRALLKDRRLAWWGVGACIGLGMLSKYTIALLAPAVLAFVALDRRARRWLVRPEPYASALLALLLFSPVLVWNAGNGWASFLFQSTRRLGEEPEFSLHVLLLSMLLLLTPLPFIGMFRSLPSWTRGRVPVGNDHDAAVRRRVFIALVTLVPLSVFLLASLRHETKVNWTGPVWLSLLPVVALAPEKKLGAGEAFERRLWFPTLLVTTLILGGLLHYLAIGLPGAGYGGSGKLPVAWEEFGRQVETIEDDLESSLGDEPLVVGMDKYFLASELAFYRRGGTEGVLYTTGQHLLRRPSSGLMYSYWFPPDRQTGKTLLLVSLKRRKLLPSSIGRHAGSLGAVHEEVVKKNDQTVFPFYWRVAYGYAPGPSAPDS